MRLSKNGRNLLIKLEGFKEASYRDSAGHLTIGVGHKVTEKNLNKKKEINMDEWRIHTPNLLKEILNNNQMSILKIPLNIFAKLLAMVADRAIIINDTELNKLMIRLTLYEEADHDNSEYDSEKILKYLKNEK